MLKDRDSISAGYIVFLDLEYGKNALSSLANRPPLLPYLPSDNKEDTAHFTKWQLAKYTKYRAAIAKIASSCNKSKEHGDRNVIPIVDDVLTADGSPDLVLAHQYVNNQGTIKKFILKQV